MKKFKLALMLFSFVFSFILLLSGAGISFASDLFNQDIGKSASSLARESDAAQKAKLLLVCDTMYNFTKDEAFLQKMKAELEKKGYTVAISKYHSKPNNHVLAIKNCPKGYWIVYGACLCCGTWRDLNIGINKGYLRSAWKKNEIKGLVFVNLSSYMIKDLKFLKRAWDDNFSPSSFTGIPNPYQYLVNAGFKVAESSKYNDNVIDSRRVPYLADEIAKAVGGEASNSSASAAKAASESNGADSGMDGLEIRSQFADENGSLGNVSGGPASLGMIMEYYGVNKSTPELAKLCGTRAKHGTGFNEMAAAAKKLGFDKSRVSTGCSVDWLKSMTDAGRPVIVHVDTAGFWPQGHYMVATGVKNGKVIIADPWTGRTSSYAIAQFKSMWSTRANRSIVIEKTGAVAKAAAGAAKAVVGVAKAAVDTASSTVKKAVSAVASSFPSPGAQYLKSSSTAPSTNSKIVSIAKDLKASTAKQTAVNVFNWMRSHVSYSFYYNSQRGALGALSRKSANCCDQANLNVALLRAAGVPARFIHSTASRFSSGTYGHVWAEAYIDGKWLSMDTTSSKNSVGSQRNCRSVGSLRKYVNVPF